MRRHDLSWLVNEFVLSLYRTESWMMSHACIFISIPVPVSTILVIMLILNASLNLTLYILFLKITSFEVHYKSFFLIENKGAHVVRSLEWTEWYVYLVSSFFYFFRIWLERIEQIWVKLSHIFWSSSSHISYIRSLLNIFYEDMILSPHSVIRIWRRWDEIRYKL